MTKDLIPRKTVYRLSLYQRCLERLCENGLQTVSSEALAKGAGVKSTQLRKDLAYFGQFGTRGLGYSVKALSQTITEVLGTTRLQPVVLVGVGNLGAALLHYNGFAKEGFEVVAAFDIHPEARALAAQPVQVFPMSDMERIIGAQNVKMGILSVPGTVAQETANHLVRSGVQAILNFAPIILQVPPPVVVNNVDLAIELENLSYFIR